MKTQIAYSDNLNQLSALTEQAQQLASKQLLHVRVHKLPTALHSRSLAWRVLGLPDLTRGGKASAEPQRSAQNR